MWDNKKFILVLFILMSIIHSGPLYASSKKFPRLLIHTGSIDPGEHIQKIINFYTKQGFSYVLKDGLEMTRFFYKEEKIILGDRELHVQGLSIYSFLDKILVLLALHNGEDGWVKIVAINEKSFKVIWEQEVPMYAGVPFFEENAMYISGIGMIGKIDLRTGQYVWKKDGLYKNNRFNSFWEPYREGADIIFEEQAEEAKNKDTYQLRVNPETGEYRVEEVPTANR